MNNTETHEQVRGQLARPLLIFPSQIEQKTTQLLTTDAETGAAVLINLVYAARHWQLASVRWQGPPFDQVITGQHSTSIMKVNK